MSSNICKHCNTDYKYPSKLRIHLQTSKRCKNKNTDEIKSQTNTRTKFTKNGKSYKCNVCTYETIVYNAMYRHNKKCMTKQTNIDKISGLPLGLILFINQGISDQLISLITEKFIKTNNLITDNVNEYICNLTINDICKNNKSLLSEIVSLFEKSIPTTVSQNIQNNTNNITNNNNNNNTNYTNTFNTNITINNVIHIHPLGYENVEKIPYNKMLDILKLSNDKKAESILKALYAIENNNNFYSCNLGQKEITFLNTEFSLTVNNLPDFIKKIFKVIKYSIAYMLIICKDDLNFDEIRSITKYIESLEKDYREYNDTEYSENKKIIEELVKSRIRSFNKKIRNKVESYYKQLIDNPELRHNADMIIKTIEENCRKIEAEFTPTLTKFELNEELGDPKKNHFVQQEIINDEFANGKYEESNYYNMWMQRKDDEEEYLQDKITKTIGDIAKIGRRKERIDYNLNKMKAKFDEYNENGCDGDVDIELESVGSDNTELWIAKQKKLEYAKKMNKDVDEELEFNLQPNSNNHIHTNDIKIPDLEYDLRKVVNK